jgi:hypothetical protein
VRGRLATIVVTAAMAILVAACLPPAPPQNGQLPDSDLTAVTPSCRVVNDLTRPLASLIYDAFSNGVAVQPETKAYVWAIPPRTESCYRSYDMQVWWRDFYCALGVCQFAAVPGTSVHGWGRAVDFEFAGNEMTFDDPGYQWLQANAGRYGFFHPDWAEPWGSSPEPWHWEHA